MRNGSVEHDLFGFGITKPRIDAAPFWGQGYALVVARETSTLLEGQTSYGSMSS